MGIAQFRRSVKGGHEPSVTAMELFFDLVYVFAFTQLSSSLEHTLSVRGFAEGAVLFGAVWWVWNYTTWAANWADPNRLPVRLMFVSLMFLSVLMAAAIPEAFADKSYLFSMSVVAMQLLRPLFMAFLMRGHRLGRNYLNVLTWAIAATPLWVTGAAVSQDTRLYWWAAALAVDLAGPATSYRVPGLQRAPMSTWQLSPGHLTERFQQILLIALGESILAMARTYSEESMSTISTLALTVAFAGSVSYWWLYFARHAGAARKRIAQAPNPSSVGRGGYAYSHSLLVAGVIVTAVGVEEMMAHPTRAGEVSANVVTLGPAMFVVGMVMFTIYTGGFDRIECFNAASFVLALVAVNLIANHLHVASVTLAAIVVSLLYVLVGVAGARSVIDRSRSGDGAS